MNENNLFSIAPSAGLGIPSSAILNFLERIIRANIIRFILLERANSCRRLLGAIFCRQHASGCIQ